MVRSSYIYFSVKNTKPIIANNPEGPGGIGLKNLKRRFEINYHPGGQLKLKQDKDTFQAAMKIPI
jgi:hypothetical protein